VIPRELLLSAYASGWFPMAVEGGEINWFSPDPRGIIPLDEFHVPSRLARVVRRGTFRIEIDRRFEEVIRACADELRDPDDPGSWISEEIIQSYLVLHRHGLAHSVEAWKGDTLAGGLYGVALKGAFFGESMFHRVTDASKVALVALVDRLRERGFRLLDIQWVTDHLVQFGAREIPRSDYLKVLDASLRAECSFSGPNTPRTLRTT
jgi:leucyl/phenylalanyl-tRNA--protein transferase